MINIYNHQRKAAQKIVCIYIMNQNILKLQVGEKKKKDVHQNTEWDNCDYFSHTLLDFSTSLTTF